MSQEQYYNGRLARRESTIGSSHEQPYHINNNATTSHTMQSSTAKRNNRISARQSLTGATRVTNVNTDPTRRKSTVGLTDMIQQSVSRTNNRKSLIPTTATPLNRSTNNRRTSSFGLSGILQQQNRDPRPLRDRNYQQNIQSEILHFLHSRNFEHEMKHSISSKTLKTPTQRDFVLIFQFLMKEIDPSYRFTKSIEHEIYSALKLIKYPYLETVSKSQISAVGGQNWPVFLGIIYYLVLLNIDLEVEEEKIDDMIDCIWDNEEEPENEHLVLDEEDRIAFQSALIVKEYVDKAYEAFMNEEDDFIDLQEEMKEKYLKLVENHKQKIQNFEKQSQELLIKFQDSQREMEKIDMLERKKSSLTEDLEKLRVYIDSLSNRRQKWDQVLQKMQDERDRVAKQIETFDKEKQEIFKDLENQGVSPNEIDQILIERERTSKAIDECVTVREEQMKLHNMKQLKVEELYTQLQELVKTYNQNIYTISSSLPQHDYTIFQLKLDNLLSEERLGTQISEILPVSKTQKINRTIQEIQESLKEKLRTVDENTMTLQEQNELCWEKLNSLTDQMDQLEIQKQKISTEIIILNDNLANDTTSFNAEIERYQKEIKDLQQHITNNITMADENVAKIDKEFNFEKSRIEREIREAQQRVNYYVMALLQYKSSIEGHADSLVELSEMELKAQEREMLQDH